MGASNKPIQIEAIIEEISQNEQSGLVSK